MVLIQSPPLLPWSALPHDLSDLILAHLSRTELLRVRSVCRAWLATITSPHFCRLHRQLHRPARPSLLLYNHAMKISTCKWQENSDESEVNAGGAPICQVAPSPVWQDLSFPATFVREWVGCRGLVCVRNHLTSNGALSVGCPFTNQWKTLPSPPRTPLLSKLWAMVPHSSSSKEAVIPYSLILLQLNTPSLYLDVYNSETNQWSQRCLPALSEVVKGAGKGHVVAFSSMAACVRGITYTIHAESRSVITYNVQRDVWKCLDAKLPAELVFQASVGQGGFISVLPQLIEGCQGKVLMAGAASASDGDDYTLAVVWELDRGSNQWREMTRAPLHMSLQMVEEAMESRKGAPVSMRCSGHGELVFVMASGAQHALHFDVIQEKWAWLELPSGVNCDLSLCIQPCNS